MVLTVSIWPTAKWSIKAIVENTYVVPPFHQAIARIVIEVQQSDQPERHLSRSKLCRRATLTIDVPTLLLMGGQARPALIIFTSTHRTKQESAGAEIRSVGLWTKRPRGRVPLTHKKGLFSQRNGPFSLLVFLPITVGELTQ